MYNKDIQRALTVFGEVAFCTVNIHTGVSDSLGPSLLDL